MAQRVLEITRHPRVAGRCTMVVDAGGVGGAVVEMMKRPPLTAPLVITGGREVGQANGATTVQKPVLMDRLEHLLRVKKLRIAPGPLTEEFFGQLMLLEREVQPSGHVTYSTPSSTEHDDLVMAVALAVWKAWTVHAHYYGRERIGGPPPVIAGSPWMWNATDRTDGSFPQTFCHAGLHYNKQANPPSGGVEFYERVCSWR